MLFRILVGVLLLAQFDPMRAPRRSDARSARGGPTIAELTISPEEPAEGEEATATIVVRDRRGVKGLRVTLGDITRDVPCRGEKVCRRTFTRVVPKVESGTVTLRIVAESLNGRRTEIEREVPVRSRTASARPPAAPPKSSPGSSKVSFRSGFEGGVTLTRPQVENGAWVQYLTGADEGYEWNRALPQRSDQPNRISYLISGRQRLEEFATSRIETVTGHDGKPTRALYMELKDEDRSTKEGSRVQFGIYPGDDLKQGYVRYRVKLQPDLASAVLPPGARKSRQLMEAKENGRPRADFRWGIYILRERGSSRLSWATRAQFGDLQRSPQAWECTSDVPVPLGEWFVLEVFWKAGIEDGRFWAAANGKVLADYVGRTQKDDSLFVWWPFKVYVGTALETFRGQPIYQWIDDFEFGPEPPSPLPATPRGDTYTCRGRS